MAVSGRGERDCVVWHEGNMLFGTPQLAWSRGPQQRRKSGQGADGHVGSGSSTNVSIDKRVEVASAQQQQQPADSSGSAAAAQIVLGSANSMHYAVTAHCDGVNHLGVMPYWKLSHGNCSIGADGSRHCYDWQQNGNSK